MKVLHVLRVDAGLYYGGGEVQAERTREALTALGVDVRVHEPLNRNLGDIVHFFGLFDAHWEIARYCIERNVPYVVSPIFVTPRSLARLRWRSFRQRYLDFKFPREHLKLLAHAAEIYPLTGFEETNLRAFFGLDGQQFARVPNGVEERFAAGDGDLFRREFGIEGQFVLHAGTVERTKNQLGLIRAVAGTDIQVVFIGRVHDSGYWAQCQAEMNPNARYLGTIPHDGPMLPSAFAAADVFCLPSRREIFPLSAMEATVAGCRIVLGSKWGGQEVWGDTAKYVDPNDEIAIRAAVQTALAEPTDNTVAADFLDRYRWSAVGAQLLARYETLVR